MLLKINSVLKVKTLPPLIGRLVPFVACSAANCINIPMMRRLEWMEGSTVETLHGDSVGKSMVAAREGIMMVTLSRIGMAMPGMVLIPVIINNLDRRGLFRRYPRLSAPLQVNGVLEFSRNINLTLHGWGYNVSPLTFWVVEPSRVI